MASLTEVARAHTDLDEADIAWLHLLTADWQIVADLSFADLVLWLPDRDGQGFWAAGQIRPTTGPTAYVDDVSGAFVPVGRRPLLDDAWTNQRLAREGDPEWRDDVPVRLEAIPVRRADRVIAVIDRNTNLLGVRTPSMLELTYLRTASDLSLMITTGHFPSTNQRGDDADTPRVGDGFVRLDADGRVEYASPNAQSAFRKLGLHGDLTERSLTEVTRELIPARKRLDEETLSAVLGGRSFRDAEIVFDDVSLVARSIPLRSGGESIGAAILVRDVSDLRRRDRELLTKDATIREIHHRVKNNLQTVAALLRLQARRIESPEGKSALEEAVRRVGSIAIVHETLSQAVEDVVVFDEIADRISSALGEVGGVGAASVRVSRQGSFGGLDSEVATPLAMVLTELLQNAVEHAFPGGAEQRERGHIVMSVERTAAALVVRVEDDGVGLPHDFDLATSTNLGLTIVKTLIESELGGSIELGTHPDGRGARAEIRVPLG